MMTSLRRLPFFRSILQFTLITSLAFAASSAIAASDDDEKEDSPDDPPVIKVLRVKKSVAVVSFSKKHSPLKAGQKGRVMKLVANDQQEVEGPSRAHFIGIDSNFELLDSKTDPGGGKTSSKSFTASFIYGWNKETIEYGVGLTYSFGTTKDAASNTESDSRRILLTGQFDFNFKPNLVENDLIYAFRLNASYGQIDNSGLAKAGSDMLIEPGIIIKWFGLSPNLGATGFLGYRIENTTYDPVKTATSGIVGRIGIQAYF